MKSTDARRARALVVVIGLITVVLACIGAGSSATGRPNVLAGGGQEEARSPRASEVEATMVRKNLAGKLEAALGDSFGGVWFDPGSAEVHVGVTSSLARRDAEAVAAQADLAGDVVEAPVPFSWAQLVAAQEEWSHRLADLFNRGEVTTSVSPESASLEVTLASSVPSTRRRTLERAADAADVAVSVEVAPQRHLFGIKGAQCEVWETKKAFCDPTIVGGVRIVSEKEASICTAGPAVRIKKPKRKDRETRTYILTAGHCIQNGGNGAMWTAFNKEGEPNGEKELGTAREYLNGETDAGVIEVDMPYWAKGNEDLIPVAPAVADWTPIAEFDPTVVKQQGTPTVGARSCLSGQRSGRVCGEIKSTTAQVKFKGETVTTKNLVEVKLGEGETGGKGDSGGPFYSESTPSAVEGTDVGFKEEGSEEQGNPVYFQSLKTSFEKLEQNKKLSLELLTESNQKRHPDLKSTSYPVTIQGSNSSGEKFITEAGTVECKSATYHAVASEESSTLTVEPEYKECKASFLEASATISMEGCSYVLHVVEQSEEEEGHFFADMDVSCPSGKSIKFTASTCSWEVKAQTDGEIVDLVDDKEASPKADITLRPTVGGLAYTVTNDGLGCPFSGTGGKANGEYTANGSTTLTGQSTTEAEKKIAIEIAEE